jgi:hypothetical protein
MDIPRQVLRKVMWKKFHLIKSCVAIPAAAQFLAQGNCYDGTEVTVCETSGKASATTHVPPKIVRRI